MFPPQRLLSRQSAVVVGVFLSVVLLVGWQFISFDKATRGDFLQDDVVNFETSRTSTANHYHLNTTTTKRPFPGDWRIDMSLLIPNKTDHVVFKRLEKTLSGKEQEVTTDRSFSRNKYTRHRSTSRKPATDNSHNDDNNKNAKNNNSTRAVVKNNPLLNCTPTTQFRVSIQQSREKQGQENWVIHSLDATGQAKTIGGDELYVTITSWDYEKNEDGRVEATSNDPTAVAILTDHQDGTYRLEWVRPFMLSSHQNNSPSAYSELRNEYPTGRLTIHFQYTCGMGQLERPIKEDWYDGGMLRQVYTVEKVPMPLMVRAPRIQTVDLSRYRQVISFGDSILNNLCGMYFNKPIYSMPNMLVRGNAGMEYSNHNLEAILTKLSDWHGKILASTTSSPNNQTTALLLGSAVWDILRPMDEKFHDAGFQDHIATVRRLLTRIQQDYPNIALIWKLPQAMHIHAVQAECWEQSSCRKRTKYESSGLVQQLYKKQKALLQELNFVSIMDIYEATYVSAGWVKPGDGRHYQPEINRALIELSYNININNSNILSEG